MSRNPSPTDPSIGEWSGLRPTKTLGIGHKMGRGRPLVTDLADIEHACKVASQDFGRSKAEIAQELRKAGASWSDGKIVACPEANRAGLMMALTTAPHRARSVAQ